MQNHRNSLLLACSLQLNLKALYTCLFPNEDNTGIFKQPKATRTRRTCRPSSPEIHNYFVAVFQRGRYSVAAHRAASQPSARLVHQSENRFRLPLLRCATRLYIQHNATQRCAKGKSKLRLLRQKRADAMRMLRDSIHVVRLQIRRLRSCLSPTECRPLMVVRMWPL